MSTAASNSNELILETRNLHVSFGKQAVLRTINLKVPRGETLVVIGESGCGKTVLLKTLIGLVRPTKGEAFFDGKNLSQLNDKQLTHERTRYGFLFQGSALFDSLTVIQNVSFPLKEHTTKNPDEIRKAASEKLGEVGLPLDVAAKRPAELSGGMRKRVGLARAWR